VAVEYWLYYPFNDYNNKHESDWEHVQVELPATDAASALRVDPTRVVYSEHEGSEYADWGASKLDIVSSTHPVVYVSSGSHANHFAEALYLGRSASQGLGCDSTLDASTSLDPVVRTIPTDPVAAAREYPWLDYQGLWGEEQARSFYSGPTGPKTKDAWDKPFTWSDQAASTSYAVPGGQVYGVNATGFFCGIVGRGSVLLLRLTANPGPTLVVLAVALLVVVGLVRRTAWGSSQPLPATQRRSTGQTVADAWELYRKHLRLYLGIGGWVALAGVVASLVAQLAAAPLGSAPGSGASPWSVVTIGVVLLMSLFSQAATVASLGELDAGRTLRSRAAYRLALRRGWPLLGTGALCLVGIVLPAATVVLLPLALVALVAFTLYVPVVQLEQRAGVAALRRSGHLVRHQVLKIVLVLLLSVGLIALLGGLLGTIVILVAQAPFVVVNLIPGLVQALLAPFTSLMVGLCYFHGLAPELEVPEDAGPADGATPVAAGLGR
jgi:Vacuolar protein sorting-associated protein 62